MLNQIETGKKITSLFDDGLEYQEVYNNMQELDSQYDDERIKTRISGHSTKSLIDKNKKMLFLSQLLSVSLVLFNLIYCIVLKIYEPIIILILGGSGVLRSLTPQNIMAIIYVNIFYPIMFFVISISFLQDEIVFLVIHASVGIIISIINLILKKKLLPHFSLFKKREIVF